MRTATIRTYLFDGGRLRLFGVEPTGPPDGGPALVALIGRAAGARVADTQVDTPKLRIFRRIGGDGPAEAIFDGHLAGSCSRARRGGWSCSTPQQSRVLGLPEALTAKGSTEGQQLGPCCVGLVAGHRAGTSTDRKASPLYPLRAGTEASGCVDAAQPLGSDVRAHGPGEGRRQPHGAAWVGDPHKAWSALMNCKD